MAKKSAGILLYRKAKDKYEAFLVHPGGPFWAKKDAQAWSVPKGEIDDLEEPLTAAVREFYEETGVRVSGHFVALEPVRQKSGKTVLVWALESDVDAEKIVSNTFEIEWPPRSGKKAKFPEVDRAAWFNFQESREKINAYQRPLIDQLEKILNQ